MGVYSALRRVPSRTEGKSEQDALLYSSAAISWLFNAWDNHAECRSVGADDGCEPASSDLCAASVCNTKLCRMTTLPLPPFSNCMGP